MFVGQRLKFKIRKPIWLQYHTYDMPTEDKVGLLILRNDITEIMLLPNVGHTSIFRKQGEDAMNLGETSYEASTTYLT